MHGDVLRMGASRGLLRVGDVALGAIALDLNRGVVPLGGVVGVLGRVAEDAQEPGRRDRVGAGKLGKAAFDVPDNAGKLWHRVAVLGEVSIIGSLPALGVFKGVLDVGEVRGSVVKTVVYEDALLVVFTPVPPASCTAKRVDLALRRLDGRHELPTFVLERLDLVGVVGWAVALEGGGTHQRFPRPTTAWSSCAR